VNFKKMISHQCWHVQGGSDLYLLKYREYFAPSSLSFVVVSTSNEHH